MDHFHYQDGQYHCEHVSMRAIAERFGTPSYIYSRATIERHYLVFDAAFGDRPHLVAYSVKANSNLGLLSLLARLGSGFDIVSAGELQRVLVAGGRPDRIVFSGVGKSADELRLALETGIRCFNVESVPELERLSRIAEEMGVVAPVSLRVNPDIDAQTHPYISTGLKENKFGIAIEDAPDVYRRAVQLPGLHVVGVDCHIGSQLTDMQPLLDALDRVLVLVDSLAGEGIHIQHIDVGGGLGVRYRDETPPAPKDWAAAVCERIGDRDIEIVMEPGRAMVANAGVLLTQVEYIKPTADRRFAIVDAAMNDLLRPALYQGWHEVVAVAENVDAPSELYDIVGPVCETGDFLAKQRELAIGEGDLLVIRSAGAYGFVMSSNYNSRPRPAEVMIDGDEMIEVRARESIEHIMAGESLLPATI